MVITCGIYLYHVPTKRILVGHPTHARWDEWSIPKGLKEGEEDLMDVAARELLEETGIGLEKIHVIRIFSLPPVKYQKQNKMLESFLVITDSNVQEIAYKSNIVSGTSFGEVDSWKWISISQAEKWLHESQQKNLKVIEELLETYQLR